jgi:hypothetical protein
MALDPAISLGFKPPVINQVNPVDTITKALSLRDMMQQQQLRQAQTEDYAAQVQQRQSDLQDQQTFQNGMQNPATRLKVASGDFSDFEGNMQEKNLDPIRASRLSYISGLAKQNTDDLNNVNSSLPVVAKAINGLKALRKDDGTLDLNKVNDALPGTLATLSPALKALKADPSVMPKTITDESQLDDLASHVGAAYELNNQALTMKEAKSKADEAAQKAIQAKNDATKSGLYNPAAGTNVYNLADVAGATPANPPKPTLSIPIKSEGEIPLGADRVAQSNQMLADRYQGVHGKNSALPPAYTLPDNATQKDYDRVHQALQSEEQAAQSRAQFAQSEGIRQALLANAQSSTKDREDAQSRKPVQATEPSTGKLVFTNYGDAVSKGYKDIVDSTGTEQNKINAARQWIPLASKMSDTSDPDKMGTLQLIQELDKKKALGPFASRFNEVMTGKVGSGDLTSDPETRAMYSALRTKLELANSLLLNVHVGQRGGSYMMEQFKNLADSGKMSADTLKNGVKSELNYAEDRAMSPSRPAQGQYKVGWTYGDKEYLGGDPKSLDSWRPHF